MSDFQGGFHAAKKAKTQKGELTRQKLLEAAEEIFGTKGYYKASVVEITQKAGVAQGTFYVYFTGKHEIFRELVIVLNKTIRREIQIATDNISERKEQERIGYQTFFNFVLRHQNLYKIVLEAQWVDEEIYKWYFKTFAEGYVQGLQKAINKGEIRNLNPECLAYCLMGITIEIGKRWILWENKGVPENVFAGMVDFIHHGMFIQKDD